MLEAESRAGTPDSSKRSSTGSAVGPTATVVKQLAAAIIQVCYRNGSSGDVLFIHVETVFFYTSLWLNMPATVPTLLFCPQIFLFILSFRLDR